MASTADGKAFNFIFIFLFLWHQWKRITHTFFTQAILDYVFDLKTTGKGKPYNIGANENIEVILGQLMDPFYDKFKEPFTVPNEFHDIPRNYEYLKITDLETGAVFECFFQLNMSHTGMHSFPNIYPY